MSRVSVRTHLPRAAGALIVVLLSVSPGHAPIAAVQESPVAAEGQSVTILPDGRRLLIGGDTTRGLVAMADPASGVIDTLPGVSPRVARAWHTATLLDDGTVLVVGGIDASGRIIAEPERFDPATRAFEPLPWDGFAPRARHTATLLTDGRVLIAGGQVPAGAADAELWNPQTERAMPLAASTMAEWRGHTARLLADGRVIVESRLSGEGPPREVFNPETNTFEPVREVPLDPEIPAVAASIPQQGAVDVPTDVRLAIRFSRPLAPGSVSPASVSLTGADGPVPIVVIPAEGGRLAFIRPTDPLESGARYTLTIDGATSHDARPLRRFSLGFTTANTDSETVVDPDADDWAPDPADPRTWRTGRPDSPWQTLPPLQARPGVTALSGQALTLSGRPLPGVALPIKGHTARTDRTGRFLLELHNVAGGRHQLEIDGATASQPGRTYGFFEYGLAITSGQTTVLPFTIWMPRIDTAHAVRIASPSAGETVVTTPRIPGLELHLPRGSIVKDRSGRVVREISITPIPVDRTPFPLPRNADVPVYFTIQPGGAYVYNAGYRPQKARLVYPNYHRLGQDVVASFWHYDPSELGWYVYGTGKVNGSRIVPDPGVGIYEFTGAMILTGWNPAAWAPYLLWWPFGDPVDPSTGLFVLKKTDLTLFDTIPLTLQRTYRPADNAVRPFGIGATHDYALFLWSAQQYTEADLILPDSARVHYVRTSPGTGWTDAVFEHTTSFTRFYKSRIVWNGNGWDLTLQDGTVYVFGENAPLQAIRDRYGNTVTVNHASGQTGNITSVMSPNGRWIAFTYDGSNRITQARDNIGRTVGYQYDASGRLWKVTDAAGGVTEYTYDTSHRMLTIKDARGIVYLTNQYDTNNRVTLQTQADSTTFQFAYTVSNGKVTQTDVTNPRGSVTRIAFNTSGYPTSLTEAQGLSAQRTTSYTRDASTQRVTSVTDPLNRVTSYGYDTNGNLTSVTQLYGTSDAVTTTYGYNGPFNLLTSVTDPLNHTTTIAYTAQGRIQSTADAANRQTTFETNAAGQILAVTDPLSHTTSFTYDGGDLVSTETPLGEIRTRLVDAAGRVIRLTEPGGSVTQLEYSALNQVTKVADPLGGETTFTYDGNGNLLTLTDARNKTTTWTYDTMDRVATRTDPLNRQESFSYDANGNLATVTDRKGQVTTSTYDALERQTFVGFGTTGNPPSYASTITTTYDAGDRATSIVDSVAGTIGRTYDLLDRLTQETTPEGTIGYTYDAANRRATMQVAGQTAVSYSYDAADRLTGVTQGSAAVGLAYDDASRRTSLTLPNSIVAEYGYDNASQVTGLTFKLGGNTLGTLTYTYDADGRRTGVNGTYARATLPPALASATYDNANQIATWAGTSSTYDSNGNLTSDGSKSYTWNARDQLTGISGGVSASFAYDGVGRRRSKTVSATTTQFLYDALNPVQELSGGLPTANLLTGLGIDQYFTRTDGTGVSNYLTDALGSTVALGNGSGTIVTDYTYEPFGATTTGGSSNGNTLGFTGRENDGTGLHYYRARYYDSRLQRFVAEDPIGFEAGDVNLHNYVFNSPVQLADPLGEAVYLYLPQCDPRNPAARKFDIPGITPVVTFLFGNPCDPANLMPGLSPLGAPIGPAGGALRRLLDLLRRALGPAGGPFGRLKYRGGVPGWLNRGPVRLGWYWNGERGFNQFGLHWGTPGDTRGFPFRYHIPFGPTSPDLRP